MMNFAVSSIIEWIIPVSSLLILYLLSLPSEPGRLATIKMKIANYWEEKETNHAYSDGAHHLRVQGELFSIILSMRGGRSFDELGPLIRWLYKRRVGELNRQKKLTIFGEKKGFHPKNFILFLTKRIFLKLSSFQILSRKSHPLFHKTFIFQVDFAVFFC